MNSATIELDCVIFGGGAAGLFTLDRLRAAGLSALVLESASLGAGQSRCAQGIIHGGTKYSLAGLLAADSRALSQMPERWLRMAEGAETPSLKHARLRSRHCWLWRSDGIAARVGMLGAKLALRSRPEEVAVEERPEVLRDRPGAVLRLPEPIFDPCSVLEAIAATHRGFVARYRAESLEVVDQGDPNDRSRADDHLSLRVEVETASPALSAPEGGGVTSDARAVPTAPARTTRSLSIRARSVILAAGVGNEQLRERFGRPEGRTQRRPLHQVLVRSSSLPWLDGHCIDGDTTRVTITSDRDENGRIIWHIGGRLAEEGVALDRAALLHRAVAEVRAVLPDAALDDTEWATYRVDRAELLEGGRRPDDARLIEEGAVLSLWPTKFALAPRAAELTLAAVQKRFAPAPMNADSAEVRGIELAPPAAAPPPWHDAIEWTRAP